MPIHLKAELAIIDGAIMFENAKRSLDSVISSDADSISYLQTHDGLKKTSRFGGLAKCIAGMLMIIGSGVAVMNKSVDAAKIDTSKTKQELVYYMQKKLEENVIKVNCAAKYGTPHTNRQMMEDYNRYTAILRVGRWKIFDNANMSEYFASAAVSFKHGNTKRAQQMLRDIDNIIDKYSENNRARLYFAKGMYIVQFLKQPSILLPEDVRILRLDFGRYQKVMNSGKVNAAINSVQGTTPKDYMRPMFGEFAKAARYGIPVAFILRFLNDNLEFQNDTKGAGDRFWGEIYSILADGYYAGGRWDQASECYQAVGATNLSDAETVMRGVESCAAAGKMQDAYYFAAYYATHWKPWLPSNQSAYKNVRSGVNQAGRFLRNAIYVLGEKNVYDPWDWPTQDIKDKETQEFLSNVDRIAKNLTGQDLVSFLSVTGLKNINNASIVRYAVFGSGRPDSKNAYYEDFMEKVVHDKKVIRDRSLFKRATSNLWEYYNALGMNSKKNSLATHYKSFH